MLPSMFKLSLYTDRNTNTPKNKSQEKELKDHILCQILSYMQVACMYAQATPWSSVIHTDICLSFKHF